MTTDCFSLSITNSNFNNFGQAKTQSSSPILVDPSYNLQYNGLVLDLDSFKGFVYLYKNTFTANVVAYSSCDVAEYFDSNTITWTSQSDSYSNYGSKTKFQLKAVISIVNHNRKILMSNNTFSRNTGTKGIVYLDILPLSTYGVAIDSNIF